MTSVQPCSTAVIIGAMLVAPLMGPLVAAGLAIVQGNVQLIRKSITVAAAGVGVALLISILIGLINPGYEPTMELEARGNPDVLDLGIALASGMAAAYALGRTNVSSTLAGVAVAAALIFRLLGARAGQGERSASPWVRRLVTGLGATVLVLSIPLIMNVLAVHRIGQPRPLSYPRGPERSRCC